MKRLAISLALASPYIFVGIFLYLGWITPGYNQFAHTISRLSIGQYGAIESLNILQLSTSLFLMIYLVRHHAKNSETVRQITLILGICAMLLTLLAIFPTDPIDTFPKKLLLVSANGLIHFGLVILFVCIAPGRIKHLYIAFKKDPEYHSLSRITAICGTLAFTASIAWFLFFFFGIYNEYRGLFQKLIALVVLYWITRIMNRIAKLFILP